ncbi:MAG: pitrilysin family protein [Candidatus Zixiibacteriota bacterium]
MKARSTTMIVLIVGALLAAGLVSAATLPPLQVEKYELPNGLDVILHEDHTLPTVAVNIWYHVGSKNEQPRRTGFAHLFEHMMFQGSEHHEGEYFEPLEKIGGGVNGSTTEDRTNYFEDVPSNYLELALWLESDRMGFLLPSMTQEKLDNQRDVVKNERRQGLENEPYGKVEELVVPLQYPEGHPYAHTVIGSMEDLSAASLDDVKNFFKSYYTPNNASLCIAGDFDPAAAKKLVEKYFANIPPGPPVDRVQTWIPTFDGVRRGTAEDNVNLPRVYMMWHTPAGYMPGDAELDLLANVLTSGKTSRLYKSLVYEKQIAQDVRAYQSSGEVSGSFNIIATARQGHTLAELESAIDEELRKVLATGITATELAQAQTAYEAGFVRRMERVGSFGGRADMLNAYNTFLGEPNKFQWDLDRYSRATAADVQRVAKQYVLLDRRLIFEVFPQGTLAAGETEIDRAQEPAPMPDPTFTPPTIEKTKLTNGMDLWLVEDHKLPLVQLNLVLKSGWAADPADRPGAASLTAELLDEGTKTRTALQISEEAKSLGASLGTGSSFDGSSVSLNVLKRNIDPALALMADVVLNPTFPNEELERRRQLYLGRIMQESKEPFTVAYKTFSRALFGPNHPYGQPYTGSGTEASIKAITRDDLVRYYDANYHPNNAAFVVSGDMTMAEAQAALEKAFKGWQPGTVASPEVPDPQPVSQTKILIVDKPGAAQSVVMAGSLGLRRNDPDFMATSVMNNALGGMFTSRINMNLREDKGYTYGAGSFFSSRRGIGPFVVYAPVETRFTDSALVQMMKELRDVLGPRPLSDAELADSKNNMIKGFPQDYFSSIGAVAGSMGSIITLGLPDDEWQTYQNRVRAIDGATATQAAKDHVHPDAVLIVVVGDRAKIEAGIKALNLGQITYADAELQ